MTRGPGHPEEEIHLKGLRKRKVVDTATAETIGRVTGVHIDPAGPAISSIALKGRGAGRIPFADVIAIGPDAITVGSADVVVDEEDPNPRDAEAFGNRLLDDAGRDLGTVSDVVVDADGSVVSIRTGGGVHVGRLLGIGSYAVVIERG